MRDFAECLFEIALLEADLSLAYLRICSSKCSQVRHVMEFPVHQLDLELLDPQEQYKLYKAN